MEKFQCVCANCGKTGRIVNVQDNQLQPAGSPMVPSKCPNSPSGNPNTPHNLKWVQIG